MVFEEESRVFQRSYMDVSKNLQGKFMEVLRVFHESFMEEEV